MNHNQIYDQVHFLRAISFGSMTKALTAVLNGNRALEPEFQDVETRLAWFMMAAEIVDGEVDLQEDSGAIMTIPIATMRNVSAGNLDGSFMQKLFSFYCRNMRSEEISGLMKSIRVMYPKLEKTLRLANRIFHSDSFVTIHLNRDADLHT